MKQNDKTFQQAIEELRAHRFAITSEEELFEHIASIGPVVQQGIQDGRSIESVTRLYFPDEVEQQTVTWIYRAVLLRSVLDQSHKEGFISSTIYDELIRFIYDLVNKNQ